MLTPLASEDLKDQNEPGTTEADLPGLLHGAIVHAAVEPGRIAAIDASAAKAAGAVVLTGQETLAIDPYHGPVVRDRTLLAIDRVRYRGEAVAAVAASSLEAARQAAASIAVTVTPLPAATTGARNGDDRIVHLTDLLRRGPFADRAPLVEHDGNRVALVQKRGNGAHIDSTVQAIDLPLPFDHSDVPMRATAAWNDGGLTVWSNGRDPDAIAAELAIVFELLPEQVTVHSMGEGPVVPGVIGLEGIAAALAQRARKPVRLSADPADFGWTGPRATLAIDAAGARLTIDAGAVAGYLPLWLEELADLAAEQLQTGEITAEVVYSERPPVAATLDTWRAAIRSIERGRG